MMQPSASELGELEGRKSTHSSQSRASGIGLLNKVVQTSRQREYGCREKVEFCDSRDFE
jgi:hypothetical protein